jgi:mannan endo-1,4-beta-mannosidase
MFLPKSNYVMRLFILLIIVLSYTAFPIFSTTHAADSSFVSRSGSSLQLGGKAYRFTGINAYQLATLWKTNAGCGAQVNDLDAFFKSFKPNSVIRIWAFQGSIGTNVQTGTLDFTPLDRVVTAAERNNQKLIIALSGQSGTCDDGHWKDRAWYLGGYRQTYNDDGRNLARIPFIEYAKLVATRYKNSPAIAMWEPVSEAEPSDCLSGYKADHCYIRDYCSSQMEAAIALRSFFDIVGGAIKQADPNHLISSGVMGTGQCGTNDEHYVYVHESPFIDVGSYHDYGLDNEALPGDKWNGLGQRIAQMKALNKPLIVGEVGIDAKNFSSECSTTENRSNLLKAKMDAGFKAGIAGFLPWSWHEQASAGCTFDMTSTDPFLVTLRNNSPTVPIPTLTPTKQPAPTSIKTPTPIKSVPTPTVVQNTAFKKLGGLDMGGYCQSIGQPSPTITNGNWKCGTTTSANINMSSVCIWQYKNQKAFARQEISGNQYSWTCYSPNTTPTTTPLPTKASIPTPTISASGRLGSLDIGRYCATIKLPAPSLTNGNWKCGTSGPDINMSSVCIWQYNLQNAYAKQDIIGNQYSWSCYK